MPRTPYPPAFEAQQRLLWRAFGGLLPLDDEQEGTEPVLALRYRHPALGEGLMIRQTPESLLEVELAAQKALGFELVEPPRPIARRRQERSFAARALAQHPDGATHHAALRAAVLLRIADRHLRHQPQVAWRRLEEAHQALHKAAPHLLPDYYEEVGQQALRHAQVQLATRAFHKARDAQRSLPGDQALEHQARAYLTFSLAGALNVRDLETWAEDLGQQADPHQAFVLVRDLCARRTLRGVPPWAGMMQLVRKMARQAGLRPIQEERRLLRTILMAGALVRAPATFWEDCRASVVWLGRQNLQLRAALLQLLPGWGQPTSYHRRWLKLLEDCGALEIVTAPPTSLPPALRLPRPAAHWWNRAIAHMTGGWRGQQVPSTLFAHLRRAAPRLRRERIPLELAPHGLFDPDLVDLALELRLPVQDPGPRVRCNLARWASPQEHSPERPRRLHHLAREPGFEPLLQRSLDDVFGDPDFEELARQCPALLVPRRQWLQSRLSRLPRLGLREALHLLGWLHHRVPPALLASFPQEHQQLAQLAWHPHLMERACQLLQAPVTQEQARRWLQLAPEALQDDLKALQLPDEVREALREATQQAQRLEALQQELLGQAPG